MDKLQCALKALTEGDLSGWREAIAPENQMDHEANGIPAIVALRDLTREGEEIFETSPVDEDFKYRLAVAALTCSALIARDAGDGELVYPPIATAMGAVAKEMYYENEEGETMSFLQTTGGEE